MGIEHPRRRVCCKFGSVLYLLGSHWFSPFEDIDVQRKFLTMLKWILCSGPMPAILATESKWLVARPFSGERPSQFQTQKSSILHTFASSSFEKLELPACSSRCLMANDLVLIGTVATCRRQGVPQLLGTGGWRCCSLVLEFQRDSRPEQQSKQAWQQEDKMDAVQFSDASNDWEQTRSSNSTNAAFLAAWGTHRSMPVCTIARKPAYLFPWQPLHALKKMLLMFDDGGLLTSTCFSARGWHGLDMTRQ